MASNKNEIEKFSYEETKKAFGIRQQHYLDKNSAAIAQGTVELWTKEKIDEYIEVIKSYKTCTNFNLDSHAGIIKHYDILESENGEKLILKTRKYQNKPVEVIPLEECFDVILNIHRSLGHRGPDYKNHYKIIQNKYEIDKIWIFLLLNTCNMCQSCANHKIPKQTVQTYYKGYQIFIFDEVPAMTEDDYKTILIVVDKMTNFINLRPLHNVEAMTVAIELLKIFADFGVPRLIEVKDKIFFKHVLKILHNFEMGLPAESVVIASMPADTPWLELVMSHLMEWMNVNDSDKWSIGCHVVQWQMNNTICHLSTPYEEVFHMKPEKDVFE